MTENEVDLEMQSQTFKVLICDLVGLKFDENGTPDASQVRDYIKARGGIFWLHGDVSAFETNKINFYYQPDLSTETEILAATSQGQFDGLIAAATFIPAGAVFKCGGVRIGAGTGNMGSSSWGGGNGIGGAAPLMNTPGFNSRATAQMTFKALLRVRPDLPVDELHHLSVAGTFDTGKDLRNFPTEKLEGQVIAILGYGNIGREVAKLAHAFGMIVKIYAREKHRLRIEQDGFIYAATALDAAQNADVLSVHTGLGTLSTASGIYANTGIVNAEILQAMKPKSVLLNYDRGECVDTSALDDAMQTNHIQHAAIDADIFVNVDGTLSGPLVPYLPLAKKYGQRIALLPHAAADTDHPSRVAGAKQAVDQIIDCIVNKRVTNLKGDLPVGYVNAGVKLGV
jgi:lactate dehydrogenase-like 2-hydroxyacid dehydrogenase